MRSFKEFLQEVAARIPTAPLGTLAPPGWEFPNMHEPNVPVGGFSSYTALANHMNLDPETNKAARVYQHLAGLVTMIVAEKNAATAGSTTPFRIDLDPSTNYTGTARNGMVINIPMKALRLGGYERFSTAEFDFAKTQGVIIETNQTGAASGEPLFNINTKLLSQKMIEVRSKMERRLTLGQSADYIAGKANSPASGGVGLTPALTF